MSNALTQDELAARESPRARPAIDERLLECLHQDPARTALNLRAHVEDDEWEALFSLARAHNVEALLAFRLRSRGIEDRLPDAVRSVAIEARRRGMKAGLLVRESLTRLTTAMKAAGIPVIVLKGAHLAHIVYPDPSLRWMIDLDLMVPQADLKGAAALLRAAGYGQDTEPADDGGSAVCHHLPRFFRALPPAVEMHWRLSDDDLPPQHEIWQRSVPVRMAGVETLGLCPEDLLLHVCAHACYSHRFMTGLRPICDVTEIVRHFGDRMIWADVEERARRYRWQRGVSLMLRLAKEMLGAAVPDEVLHRLPSDHVDDAIRTARAMILDGHQIARGFPARFFSMSSATTWPVRLRVLWHSLFLPADLLAANHGVSPQSLRVLLYYPVRLKYLLQRYGADVMRLVRRDPALTPVARKVATIQHWLSDEPKLD